MAIVTEQMQSAMPCNSCGKKDHNRFIEVMIESIRTRDTVARLKTTLCQRCREGLADDIKGG